MYEIGMKLSVPDRERIVIKVPVTVQGTKAAAMLIGANVWVCLTACYNPHQAIVAAGLGAEYLAPYLGRIMDLPGRDGMDEVSYPGRKKTWTVNVYCIGKRCCKQTREQSVT
jgi:transaldolase